MQSLKLHGDGSGQPGVVGHQRGNSSTAAWRSSGRQASLEAARPIMDNGCMAAPADWHPLLPAHSLGKGDRLVGTRLLGQDLVAWRSALGVAQVWRDRCPHRGVRLSLGRVVSGRLSCAYHGWEFSAGDGRCTRIPALDDLAEVPGAVHASVCEAAEAGQMVWVRLAGDGARAKDRPDIGLPDLPAAVFLRTLGLRAPRAAVASRLHSQGLQAHGTAAWQGTLDSLPLRMFLLAAQDDLTLAHAWLLQPPARAGLDGAFAALWRLRHAVESAADARP